jgi:hypothetical protein
VQSRQSPCGSGRPAAPAACQSRPLRRLRTCAGATARACVVGSCPKAPTALTPPPPLRSQGKAVLLLSQPTHARTEGSFVVFQACRCHGAQPVQLQQHSAVGASAWQGGKVACVELCSTRVDAPQRYTTHMRTL